MTGKSVSINLGIHFQVNEEKEILCNAFFEARNTMIPQQDNSTTRKKSSSNILVNQNQ
jgi:hypothetical protein